MLLVDPGSRGLAVYGRDGRRRREVGLDAVAELDYSVPMRLERREDGYALIDQTQIHPRSGRRLLRVVLPSEAQRLHLVPGRGFWTAIEESEAPNLGQAGDRTSFLFLPGREILSGELGCLR